MKPVFREYPGTARSLKGIISKPEKAHMGAQDIIKKIEISPYPDLPLCIRIPEAGGEFFTVTIIFKQCFAFLPLYFITLPAGT